MDFLGSDVPPLEQETPFRAVPHFSTRIWVLRLECSKLSPAHHRGAYETLPIPAFESLRSGSMDAGTRSRTGRSSQRLGGWAVRSSGGVTDSDSVQKACTGQEV